MMLELEHSNVDMEEEEIKEEENQESIMRQTQPMPNIRGILGNTHNLKRGTLVIPVETESARDSSPRHRAAASSVNQSGRQLDES